MTRTSSTNAPTIVVAEDDDQMRDMLVAALRHRRYLVIAVSDGGELLTRVKATAQPLPHDAVALIISDHRMPGKTGLEVLEYIHRKRLPVPLILITAFGDREVHARARKLGAVKVLDKPFPLNELMDHVGRLVPVPPDPKHGLPSTPG